MWRYAKRSDDMWRDARWGRTQEHTDRTLSTNITRDLLIEYSYLILFSFVSFFCMAFRHKSGMYHVFLCCILRGKPTSTRSPTAVPGSSRHGGCSATGLQLLKQRAEQHYARRIQNTSGTQYHTTNIDIILMYIYIYMYVCMYACMHACMYVCMYV